MAKASMQVFWCDPLFMGMLNMRERANLINAGSHISSSTDAGTIIELNVNTNGKSISSINASSIRSP